MSNIEKAKVQGTLYDLGKPIDTTLTQTGYAADAKAVGDRITAVAEQAATDLYNSYVVEESSGPIAHFEDGADTIPMKDVLVHIEPVQAGSGDPSPDNIRPITGWTSATVTRRGKNLMGKPAWATRTQDGVTATLLEDGRVSVTGTGTNTGLAVIAYNSVDLPAGTYIFNGQNNADVNKKLTLQTYNLTDDTQIVNRDTATDYTFTLDKPSRVAIRIGLRTGVNVTDAILSPMIRHVSSADPTYEPYVSQTRSITFPAEAGTVYGGTLDVTSGVLTVTHKLYTFDGSENWVVGNYSYRYEFYSTIPDGTNFRTWVDGGRGLSNIGIYDGTAHSTESAKDYIASRTTLASSATGNRQHVLITPPSIATTVEELKAFLANTPEQWYAPLQNPQTYQLTPQEIASLFGTNNLWADTGDTEVEYRADAKLYITKKITEAVSALS